MTPPNGKQIIKGEIADNIYEDGILVSYSKSPVRTVENITANIARVKSITQNHKVPLLIYLAKSPVPDKATREFSAKMLPEVYTAMAMVSASGLGKIIMNILFGLKKPPIPMKTFTDDVAAKAWLKGFL